MIVELVRNDVILSPVADRRTGRRGRLNSSFLGHAERKAIEQAVEYSATRARRSLGLRADGGVTEEVHPLTELILELPLAVPNFDEDCGAGPTDPSSIRSSEGIDWFLFLIRFVRSVTSNRLLGSRVRSCWCYSDGMRHGWKGP
jgi:hypothetical protein